MLEKTYKEITIRYQDAVAHFLNDEDVELAVCPFGTPSFMLLPGAPEPRAVSVMNPGIGLRTGTVKKVRIVFSEGSIQAIEEHAVDAQNATSGVLFIPKPLEMTINVGDAKSALDKLILPDPVVHGTAKVIRAADKE